MNTNAVYMTGNGKMAAAYRNGDLIQVFGPPYSSPSVFKSSFVNDEYVRSVPKHKPDAAIWQIDLQKEQTVAVTVTDFVLADEPCLVRHIEAAVPVTMRLTSFDDTGDLFHYVDLQEYNGAPYHLFKTRNGNAAYNDYPLPFPQFFALLIRGDAVTVQKENFTFDITVNGTADILLIGGPSYPECCEAVARISPVPFETLLKNTVLWWSEIFKFVTVRTEIPRTMPQYDSILQAIEDTVINIIVQQGKEGGVLAGYAYHMGYVRDQYGVCMAMLKLGLVKQARQMLQFYIDVFRHNGKILNAQAMGVNGMFHFAENDATEITGYLLLQFFRYARHTNDFQFLFENVDFLQWLYEQQLSQLYNGALPFNGDETYIAGGLLPRDVINEGSAEATMLFILSGEALAAFLEDHRLASPDTIAGMRQTLSQTRLEYTDHFVLNGQYTLNDPSRTVGMELPKYRYGVCMNLGKDNCDFFGWTQLCEGDVYLCPRCISRRDYPKKINKLFSLPSALLMPSYLDAHLLDCSLITAYLEKLTGELNTNGHVYSDEQNQKNVGYDYGLLLYNLVHHDLPGKEAVCEKLLSQIDETGAWAEYYIADEPSGTRYRPWESGINVDALITYALSLKE